jgi:glycosyltransferase involved in cell wall biosynthesis
LAAGGRAADSAGHHQAGNSVNGPFISVVMPVRQGMNVLPQSLAALGASDLPRTEWELIVVDDVSPDDTALIAAQYADIIVRLSGKSRGPAYARNRGFEVSRGSIIVFIDADVCVHPETLRRFADAFRNDPDVAAVFGSYDASPPGAGVVSQFRNLMHHYVHNANPGEAETFWAGCGAVRADVFEEVGMFDEWHYHRPQIEDIELGRRLRRLNRRIVLDPAIQGTHLKRWTFLNMLTTDFKHRGTAWMWLLLKEGHSAGDNALNLRVVEKLCTAMVGIACVALLTALLWLSWWPLTVAAIALVFVIIMQRRFYGYLRRQRSLQFALQVIPLHLLFYVVSGLSVFSGWILHRLFGEPIPPNDVAAQAELGIETWPPGPARPARSIWTAPHERA